MQSLPTRELILASVRKPKTGHDKEHGGSDLSRRWRFVLLASGMANQDAINKVAAFCELYKSIEFPPTANCFQTKHRYAGAACVLADFWFQIGRTHDNTEYAVHYDLGKKVDDQVTLVQTECLCFDGIVFKELMRAKFNRLRCLIQSIDHSVRRELLSWFFGRQMTGLVLVDEDGELILNRDDIDQLHREYSALYYEKNGKICSCHGVY